MRESVIQRWVEKVIKDGQFKEHIKAIEEPKRLLMNMYREDYFPEFPIDYLLRKNSLAAAAHVLDRLGFVEIVSTTRNISRTKGESLLPDLVLCNPESNHVIVVEIKRSSQTEREAITELLGYEHEIRNHFPFLSNLDICFILISTGFSTLLDHSVSSLLMWGKKQVLCLRLDHSSSPWTFHVHLPGAWEPVGQGVLPENSIPTVQISLYPKDGDDDQPDLLLPHLITAFDCIVREGDRTESHGFLMLWKDAFWKGEKGISQCQWNLTIGVINPFSFLASLSALGLVSEEPTSLFKYYLNYQYGDLDSITPSSCFAIAKKGYPILQEHWNPHFEGLVNWHNAREEILSHRAFPVLIDFWGTLGDYARDYIAHPFVRKHFAPEVAKRGLSWSNPRVGISLLNDLTGHRLFSQGAFTIKDIFKVGVLIGTLMSVYNSLDKKHSCKDNPILAAWSIWLESELSSAVHEVAYRYLSSDLKQAPPTIKIGIEVKRKKSIKSLDKFAKWFYKRFLSKHNQYHRDFFMHGIRRHYYFQPFLKKSMEPSMISQCEHELAELSSILLQEIAEDSIKHIKDSPIFEEVLRCIATDYLQLKLKKRDINILPRTISNVDPQAHAELFSTTLIHILDILLPPVFHILADMGPVGPDWEWMKQQVNSHRKRGIKNVAVVLTGNGMWAIASIESPIGDVTYPEDEVLFRNELSGVTTITKVKWEELGSGKT